MTITPPLAPDNLGQLPPRPQPPERLPVHVDPLPAELTSRGGAASLVFDELKWIIGEGLAEQPRSVQRAIGPSELGGPCARRIGYKLLDTATLNPRRDPNWKAGVGTGVHQLLADLFDGFNLMFADSTGHGERFFVEHRVAVGAVGGREVLGSLDLYDRVTATVVDWKTTGPAQLAAYRANGPGMQYRVQAHLYGRGLARSGHPVDRVMIVFLPRQGELREAHAWTEAYDESVALQGIARADAIATAVTIGGRAALNLLPTSDNYCLTCPYYVAHSTDPRDGCPGAVEARLAPALAPLTLDIAPTPPPQPKGTQLL